MSKENLYYDPGQEIIAHICLQVRRMIENATVAPEFADINKKVIQVQIIEVIEKAIQQGILPENTPQDIQYYEDLC